MFMTSSFHVNIWYERERRLDACKYYNRNFLNLRKKTDCRDVALMTTSRHVDIRYGWALDPECVGSLVFF